MNPTMRRWATGLAALPTAGALGVGALSLLTHKVAASRTFTVTEVPETPVAIVFGAQVHPGGKPSGFLTGRLVVAAHLWHSGKVEAIVVSGDDSAEHHHEATSMKRWLIEHDVAAQRIVIDPEGVDTFATISRAIGVYGLEEATLVTQSYHLPRALTTARALGLHAYGVGDTTASMWERRWRQGQLREIPANIKLAAELLVRDRPATADPSVMAALLAEDSEHDPGTP